MKNLFGRFLSAVVAIGLVFSSCIHEQLEFDKIRSQNWEALWAAPLIDSRLSLHDLITDSLTSIIEDEDGLLSLVYQTDNLFSQPAGQVVTIPDQSFEMEEEYLIPSLQPGEEGSVPLTLFLDFETDTTDQRIDSLYLKKGSFYINVRSTLNREKVKTHITVPSLLHAVSRDTLRFTLDVSNPAGGNVIAHDTTIELNGFIMAFDKDVFTQNRVEINALVTYMEDGNPDLSPYSLVLENSFTGLEYTQVYGYLGSYSYLMTDSLLLEVLKMNQDKQFFFGPGSVALDITAHNSVGCPVRLRITELIALDDATGEVLPVELGVPWFDLNFPSFSQQGEYASTLFTSVPSNLDVVINNSFSRFYIEAEALMNPMGDTTIMNFVLDTSTVKVGIGVSLQLFGALDNFTVTDTVDFDAAIVDDLNSISFSVVTENLFPLIADIRVLFLDSLDTPLYDLIPADEKLLDAAAVDGPPSYRAYSPVFKEINIPVQGEDLELVREARRIAVSARLSTPQNQLVKVYSDYYVRVRLGALAGIKY